MLLLGGLFAQSSVPPLPPQQQQPARIAPPPQGYCIAGTVVNSLTGQPIASASVAIAPLARGAEREISRSALTGADGRFSFAGLGRGKYSLMATARGFSLQYFDHHDPYATAIATGPESDSEHLVFRLQPDGAIEGVVTDENGDPVQYATVRLFHMNTESGQQKVLPENQAQTDDQGRYHIGHVAAGAWYVAVSARPWYAQNTRAPEIYDGSLKVVSPSAQVPQPAVTLDVTYPLTFYPDATDSASATPLRLALGERATANVVLHAVPSLHLRIHTGGAAESAAIGKMVFPAVSQRLFGGYLDSISEATTSWVAPGVIEISGLAPGHYVVEMPASPAGSNDKGGRAWFREIDLAGDTEISATEGPGFVALDGRILVGNAAHLPKPAFIELSNPDTGESFRGDLSERGEFDLRSNNIRPGRYQLLLRNAGGFYLTKLSADGAKITGRTVDIGAAASVHVSAVAAQGTGRVNGAAMRDNESFAGAMIVLVPQDAANNAPLFRRDQSDSDGTFTLSDVVPGQYTVIAIANGWDLEWANPTVLQPYLKRGETVQVPPGGELNVKVQVQ
ncbi:MAG TPA: carboxypeptidase-like regulatory domain-containing protein [Candidatus Binatia bacterium]|nr:carboxypeptidase-like regulatory domain-containing protein [Candidatus Binatia bacterium]